MKNLLIIPLFFVSLCMLAQNEKAIDLSSTDDNLPYQIIPAEPAEYTATTVMARAVDGLGFRYYWATEGLRQEDLDYKPSEGGRTTFETLYHIYGLTEVINNTVKEKPSLRPLAELTMSFEEMREETLLLLKEASEILRGATPSDLNGFKVIFQRGENSSEFPFWNLINGPIEDAVWHVGQVVSHRRASGNPFNFRASVLTGTVRNN